MAAQRRFENEKSQQLAAALLLLVLAGAARVPTVITGKAAFSDYMRQKPGVRRKITLTLTLALGIGANAAIFTVVQSALLAPLPYQNADRLAVLDTHWTNSGHTTPRVTGPDAVDVRDQAFYANQIHMSCGQK